MYLRESRRTNRDGSVVRYLQLAHNERHPVSGASVAKVIHSFGRAELVDRAALARLVSSISRFLTPQEAVAAASGAEIEVLDSRPMGGAWVLTCKAGWPMRCSTSPPGSVNRPETLCRWRTG